MLFMCDTVVENSPVWSWKDELRHCPHLEAAELTCQVVNNDRINLLLFLYHHHSATLQHPTEPAADASCRNTQRTNIIYG